ncbi:toxin-antitoxin system YwqK family antitoxin [Xylophilus ampelinus]|uniref:toxin-antitoxin system YwqK family antitoxin n=1 Tax=Xylophilus ampelinus TaxID=54067 RepID=UPI001F473D3A|nr:hypothetical protein [Xylophilus ampelinus]MCS4511396.1 hypothetical protein [Xylophilus ampelinus]
MSLSSCPAPPCVASTLRRGLACGLGLLLCGSAWAVQDCDLNGEFVSPIGGSSLQGRTGTIRCRERGTGMPTREQEVQDGKFIGQVRYFSENRLSREHVLNERGNIHGRAREFAPSGQVLRDTVYDDGRQVGMARNFYANGLLQRASFSNAKGEIASAEFNAHGELRRLQCADRPVLAPVVDDARLCGFAGKPSQIAFYSETGVLHARGTYAAGKRVRYETLQENGHVSQQEELSATGRIERSFDTAGTKRREVIWSMAGGKAVREREQEFSHTGVLLRERRWTQGELSGESTFFPNGQRRSVAQYDVAGTARVLDTREFYDNGTLAAESRYIDTGRYAPIPTGIHRRFDTQGRLRSESVYDARGRLSRARTYDEAGRLVRDDEVEEDGSRRAMAR